MTSTKNPTPRRYHKRSFSTSTAHEYHSSAIRCLLGSVQNMRLCAQPQICKTAKTQRQFDRYTIRINSSKSIETVKGSSQRSHTLTGGKSLAPALQNSYLGYTRFTTLNLSQWILLNISQIYLIYLWCNSRPKTITTSKKLIKMKKCIIIIIKHNKKK